MGPASDDTLEQAFRSKLAELAPPGPLGVAVSGGGDSVALLALAQRAGRQVQAATVDHGLRFEAAEEAATVARFCAERRIRHDTLTIDLAGHGGNLPARAREARYDALAAWAAGHGLAAVLLGHTADDQAETVLMRLARASGIDGLSGMAPARRWKGTLWLRPLLGASRAELREWLHDHGIAWIEDPTNEDPAYDRVRARRVLDLLEPLGVTRDGLARTAAHLARQREVLEDARARLEREIVTLGELGEVFIGRAGLAAALPETAARLMAHVLVSVSGQAYRPGIDQISALLARFDRGSAAAQALSGCLVTALDGDLLVTREPARTRIPAVDAGTVVWDDRWQVEAPPGSGLWVGALGGDCLPHATAALRRLGIEPPEVWKGAHRAVREACPAVFSDEKGGPDRLLAVPSAGLVVDRRAAGVRVRPPSALDPGPSVRQDDME